MFRHTHILSACLCVCALNSQCVGIVSASTSSILFDSGIIYVDKITVTKDPNRIFKGMKLMAGGSIKIGYPMAWVISSMACWDISHFVRCFSQRTKPQNRMVPLPMIY